MIAWIALAVSIASLVISYRNYAATHSTKTEEKKTEALLLSSQIAFIYDDIGSMYSRSQRLVETGWIGATYEHKVGTLSELRYRMSQLKEQMEEESRKINAMKPSTPAQMEAKVRHLKDMLLRGR